MSSRGGGQLENLGFFPRSSSTLWVVNAKVRLSWFIVDYSVVPQDNGEDRKLEKALVKGMRS